MEAALGRFYSTSIGKKVVMAATGFLLFGFVIVHLLGNLQVFAGPERINAYAAFLHGSPALLWGMRAVLLLTAALHITTALALKLQNWRGRPVAYQVSHPVASTIFSRNMLWTGLLLASFVVFHLLHLTVGALHPDFVAADVHRNLTVGFSRWPVVALYVAAMLALGAHLLHGLFALFQSAGLARTREDSWRRRLATGATLLLVAGNVSLPVAVIVTRELAR